MWEDNLNKTECHKMIIRYSPSCDVWRQLQQSFSRYEDNVVHLTTTEVSNSAWGDRWSEHYFLNCHDWEKAADSRHADFRGEFFGMILTVW